MHRSWRYIAIFLICFWAVLPGLAHAEAVQITEIMYDLDGTDADREWLEVRNVSDSSIDLSDWRFHENDTDHLLSAAEEGESTTLASGAYAVIADTPSAFRGDYPGYGGLLLDSAFTLANTGETLAMTNPDGDVVASVTYDPAIGAGGDGNSLQLQGGSWIAAEPTPGAENAMFASTASDDADTDNDDDDNDIYILDPRPDPPDIAENINIEAVGKKTAISGIEMDFYAKISGIEQRQRSDLDIAWSLGNGATAHGEEISYTYNHPGEYVVTLRVEDDDGNIYTDTLTVQVREAAFHIMDVQSGTDGHISLRNNTGRSVDVSGWQLASDDDTFTFPSHTIMLNAQEMIVPADVSGLTGFQAAFALPDGTVVATSSSEKDDDEAGDTGSESTQPVVTYTAPAPAEDSGEAVDESTSTEEPQVRGTSTATTATSSVSPADAFSDTTRAAGTTRDSDLLWQWGGMLMLLLVITVGTALLLRRVSKSTVDPIVQAAKFDINEISKNKE